MTTMNPSSRMRPLQQKILLPLTITSILLVVAVIAGLYFLAERLFGKGR